MSPIQARVMNSSFIMLNNPDTSSALSSPVFMVVKHATYMNELSSSLIEHKNELSLSSSL
ncbi:hypothetical protein F511_04585 [Dorcoceras hygrometricum]|uniref:Uncharacterized protein n=1 Tax=Dorcoceras hygrometricum TaxID=472368 RepID=A0A2Z7B1A3_9LAMI|nr:hypothetical protein F511_04585 [Dorcoceras hygrometricum]